MGEGKIERETGAGERMSNRDGREKDRKRDRSRRETETERGRETGVGERETGEKEKKLQTLKNSWNLILSCYTPQNGVIRLPYMMHGS